MLLPLELTNPLQEFFLINYSLDIDFLTIPLKYRPHSDSLPHQLNTNLNGAFYLGYCLDKYRLRYEKKITKKYERYVDHYGASLGFFTGIGATFMNSTNTNNRISQEYDGIVWSKGIAGIIAIDKVTLGVALGFDTLLDKNNDLWIYKDKAWLGLTFGLNIN